MSSHVLPHLFRTLDCPPPLSLTLTPLRLTSALLSHTPMALRLTPPLLGLTLTPLRLTTPLLGLALMPLYLASPLLILALSLVLGSFDAILEDVSCCQGPVPRVPWATDKSRYNLVFSSGKRLGT
jgi:hypothetical protein